MKTRIILCFLLTISVGYHVHGQYRSAAFTMDNGQSGQTVSMARTFTTDEDVPLTVPSPVYSFSLSGNATLKDTANSLIRITLVDNYDMEHLVYEIYPLLTDRWRFDFDHMAFETSGMDGVRVTGMRIRLLNAELTLAEYHYTTEPARSIQRQQRFKSQQQYIIETLNANLEARNMPWRAGETSVSNLSYEEKKNLFGGTVPNLNGFEYYIGGIFVMPDYQPEQVAQSQEAQEIQAAAAVPSSWDWRNKDGKNWMTPVKNQSMCGSCWAFATLGMVEAYANVYFNHQLDLDLSEQELVSCDNNNGGCNGGVNRFALQYVKSEGIKDEQSFPYKAKKVECNIGNYNEKISVKDFIVFDTKKQSENNLKELLMQAPMCMAIHIKGLNHAMVLVGYKTLKSGDEIYVRDTNGIGNWIIIDDDNPLVGATAWLFKNSWGHYFGDGGYMYMCVNWDALDDICAIRGGVEDSKCIVINNAVSWNERNTVDKRVFIRNGGALSISSTIMLGNSRYIIVENGGKLIINGGVLNNASIEVKSGGQLQLINNGTIKLRNSAALDVKKGGILDFRSGYIN